MRLIKVLIIILIIFLITISGSWFYLAKKIANELNTKYAGKEFAVNGIDKTDYFISFDHINIAGFPYKMAWKMNGWREESRAAAIIYNSPIEFGYDFLSQYWFINYNGDVIASYKPAKQGFGSRIAIKNYNITIEMPLSIELFKTLTRLTDPGQIINYIKGGQISTDKVEIFDLVNNEKFYDKEYERAIWSFKRAQNYESLGDLLAHIPQEYQIDYTVKTKPIGAISRRLPSSLFYSFSLLPTDIDLVLSAKIKTKGNNFDEFMKEVDINALIDYKSSYLNLSNINLAYKGQNYDQEFALNISSRITLNPGLFDYLFKTYDSYISHLPKSHALALVDSQFNYIIQNQEVLKPQELENNSYDFHLKMNSSIDSGKQYTKIEDFNIQSDKSGIRFRHEMEANSGFKNQWYMRGVLYLNNYPSILEHAGRYIYRFGEFKSINDKARELYLNTNITFLKTISDHPESSSNDLSFEYNIDSNHINDAKIGTTKFDSLKQLYDLTLYQKLFDIVGYEGDITAKMKEILPELNTDDPILKNILAKISNSKINKENNDSTKN